MREIYPLQFYAMDPYYNCFLFHQILQHNLTFFFLSFLTGGHTIGTSACQSFKYRTYNFTKVGNGAMDPAIDPSFLPQLRALCPQNGDDSKRVALDTGSPNRFDTSYFINLRNGRGILESDQMLWADTSTKTIVQHFSIGLSFNLAFVKSMIKMSNIGVKRGNAGEIRKICSKIN